jgi:hypothetical protein
MLSLFGALENLPLFPFSWAEGGSRGKFLMKAKEAKDEQQIFSEKLNAVLADLNENVFKEVSQWLLSFRGILDKIRSLDEKLDVEENTLLNMLLKKYEPVKTVTAEIERIAALYEKGAALLRLQPEGVFGDIEALAESLSALVKLPGLNRSWFDAALYSRVKKLFTGAREHAETLTAKNSAVREAWEDAAFSLDAEAMLGRFKREYTSFLKILKPSCRSDMRAVRAVSKKAGAKITASGAAALLQLLREIATEKNWFYEQAKHLEDSFGGLYFGIPTDWETAGACLSLVEKLYSLYPRGIIPPGQPQYKLQRIVSRKSGS